MKFLLVLVLYKYKQFEDIFTRAKTKFKRGFT